MNQIENLTKIINDFRDARDWRQFHNLKDIAISLSLEASEVLEHFQWKSTEEIKKYIKENKKEIADEVADVFYWVLLMSSDLEIDIEKALENKIEIYIGQTVNAYYRSKQHYENPERRKLNEIHIITDEEFNISATLDIESWLIQYISADGKYILQNGNGGLKNHNYYDRVKYRTKFEITWEKLRESGIAHNTLLDLENSDLFKYSPYKSLTSDQINIVRKIYQQLSKNERNIFIINGSAGTGKTILATFLLKYLKEQDKTKNFKIGLVLPMGAIRGTVKKVIKKIKGLNANMVIGPSESLRDSYDLLIVDESHRLHRSKNITNIGAHYKNNEKLGLGQKEGTELDWIIKQSKNQILFYDVDQLVHPSCIRPEDINKLKGQSFLLEEQMRIEAG